jgi:hypothetical protein
VIVFLAPGASGAGAAADGVAAVRSLRFVAAVALAALVDACVDVYLYNAELLDGECTTSLLDVVTSITCRLNR